MSLESAISDALALPRMERLAKAHMLRGIAEEIELHPTALAELDPLAGEGVDPARIATALRHLAEIIEP